jgi:hypothetical protein
MVPFITSRTTCPAAVCVAGLFLWERGSPASVTQSASCVTLEVSTNPAPAILTGGGVSCSISDFHRIIRQNQPIRHPGRLGNLPSASPSSRTRSIFRGLLGLVAYRRLLPVHPLRLFSEHNPTGRHVLECAFYRRLTCLRRAIFGLGCSLSISIRPERHIRRTPDRRGRSVRRRLYRFCGVALAATVQSLGSSGIIRQRSAHKASGLRNGGRPLLCTVDHSLCQLLANACIAAWRVASYRRSS